MRRRRSCMQVYARSSCCGNLTAPDLVMTADLGQTMGQTTDQPRPSTTGEAIPFCLRLVSLINLSSNRRAMGGSSITRKDGGAVATARQIFLPKIPKRVARNRPGQTHARPSYSTWFSLRGTQQACAFFGRHPDPDPAASCPNPPVSVRIPKRYLFLWNKHAKRFRAFRKSATPRLTCSAALAGYIPRPKPPQSLPLGQRTRA